MADETTGPAESSNIQPNTGGIPAVPQAGPKGVPPQQADGTPFASASISSPQQPLPATNESKMGADLAKILQEIKLPEHRDSKPAATDASVRPAAIPTTVGAPLPSAPIHAPQAAAAPIQSTPEKSEGSIQSVHTLKQDLQHVVQTQKISVVRAVSLEQDRAKPEVVVPQTPQSHRVKNMLFAVALLLLLGGAALFGVYTVVQQRSAPLPQQQADSLVFAERTVALPIDGQSATVLKKILSDARNASSGSLGSITRIVPTKSVPIEGQAQPGTRLATVQEFFSAIGAHPPEELTRALTGEFFFGLHTVDKNAPLLVMTVSSYDRAFASMLAWEKTMNPNLSPIFTAVPPLTLGPDGLPAERSFTDVVMRNYDVRALKDDQGVVQLYYSFPTRDTLVIAESPYTFAELLSRLQAGRKL